MFKDGFWHCRGASRCRHTHLPASPNTRKNMYICIHTTHMEKKKIKFVLLLKQHAFTQCRATRKGFLLQLFLKIKNYAENTKLLDLMRCFSFILTKYEMFTSSNQRKNRNQKLTLMKTCYIYLLKVGVSLSLWVKGWKVWLFSMRFKIASSLISASSTFCLVLP